MLRCSLTAIAALNSIALATSMTLPINQNSSLSLNDIQKVRRSETSTSPIRVTQNDKIQISKLGGLMSSITKISKTEFPQITTIIKDKENIEYWTKSTNSIEIISEKKSSLIDFLIVMLSVFCCCFCFVYHCINEARFKGGPRRSTNTRVRSLSVHFTRPISPGHTSPTMPITERPLTEAQLLALSASQPLIYQTPNDSTISH